MNPDGSPQDDRPSMTFWERACLCAAVFAVDPHGLGGIVLRARAGPVRDAWLDELQDLLGPEIRLRKVPTGIGEDRLLGGLDLTATLRSGTPVAQSGLLAEADGGVLLLAMAERLPPGNAGHIAAALDQGEVVAEREGMTVRSRTRFGVVALDEGVEDDECPPGALTERLALHTDLTDVSMRDILDVPFTVEEVEAARHVYPRVAVADETVKALCDVAMALGVHSLRVPSLALKVARACAALDGRTVLSEQDAVQAASLVLLPRATVFPPPDEGRADEEGAQEEQPPEDDEEQDGEASQPEPDPGESEDQKALPDQPLEDLVLDAAMASLPEDLLARLQIANQPRGPTGGTGRAGAMNITRRRGRPIGVRKGDPATGRLNVIETLRAAAPWQTLRRGLNNGTALGQGLASTENTTRERGRIQVRTDDFRITRFKHRTETITIFVVDASGSAALHRLAEAKGAVELLLADCYVRRDEVALIAFRGQGADLILPPTRSLVRAKRSLAALPGGGGTPLAAGIDAARILVEAVKRKGLTPVIVLLTDGQGNIARDGTPDRGKAAEDALAAARALRLQNAASILIDTAPRRRGSLPDLAQEMGARYVALPHAQAQAVSAVVQSVIAS